MKLVLFHDAAARRWTPFVETRPVGELLYGTLLLRERAERALGLRASGYAGAPWLEGFDEEGAPPAWTPGSHGDEDRLFLCVRAVVDRVPEAPSGATATLRIGDRVAGWIVPAGQPEPPPDALGSPDGSPAGDALPVAGELIERPWHLMAGNAARILADASARTPGGDAFLLTGVPVLGEHRVVLEKGAVVEAGVVIDVRAGPVWLAAGARAEGPARLTGPLWIGPGSTVLGGPVGTSSIGPGCKVRGEVADSVLLGRVNKAHDGHLGHAVLGRWVNLGAGTINSDLKNTYSPVRLRLPEGDIDTGLLKVGSFLGDHVKTGIGTLLTTGAVLGAGCNVFGGRMPPAYVPPFSWGTGDDLIEHRLDRFLATAEAAMARREVELSAGMRQVLTRAWERSRSQRSP